VSSGSSDGNNEERAGATNCQTHAEPAGRTTQHSPVKQRRARTKETRGSSSSSSWWERQAARVAPDLTAHELWLVESLAAVDCDADRRAYRALCSQLTPRLAILLDARHH
jgi:hypothetical protein